MLYDESTAPTGNYVMTCRQFTGINLVEIRSCHVARETITSIIGCEYFSREMARPVIRLGLYQNLTFNALT